MSDHQLPDDLSRWPENAYQLLGVVPGVGPRELRRAYTRLIRTYKPEQYPEHFRRIREAYESLLHYAEFLGVSDSPSEPDASPEADVSAPKSARRNEPSPRPEAEDGERIAAPPPYRPPDVAELWQMARDGDAATAYRRLVQLEETEAGRTDVCLAAYWLLVLEPRLDSGRGPCDWLARGLEASRLAGPLHELYRREIAENPAEALSGRCSRLLRAPAAAGLLAELAEWRWRAAARLKRLSILGLDLERLRPRLEAKEEEIWLRLLLTATGLLAFDQLPEFQPLFQKCLEEIEAHEHWHLRMPAAFDQYEFQRSIADGIPRLYSLPRPPNLAAIAELVKLAQNRPFPELRPVLLPLLSDLTQPPTQALGCLDRVHQTAPAVLAEFGNLLQQLASTLPDEDDDRDPEDFADLVDTFLAGLSSKDHQKFRLELLHFCLREAMDPHRAADCMAAQEYPALCQQVHDDWPLRHAWLACHIMGG